MSSYTAEMIHGLGRADSPIPRHPKPRWQVRYPDDAGHERSAGIYPTARSAETVRKQVEKRMLPAFGNTPLAELDADRIGAWKATLMSDGLKPATVNTYLALLGTILGAGSSYTIAENDFMVTGGDGYPNLSSRATTRDIMDQVVADHIAAQSPISPAIQARINCTTSGATACPIVTP